MALYPDDVVANELGTIAGSVLGMLKATFPFQRCPAAVAILGELGEDQAEVDIAVAGGPKPAGALQPVDVSRVNPRLGAAIPFGILDVKGNNALLVDVKEAAVVDVLQEEVRGIIEDARGRVLPDDAKETLKREAVVQVLAGMQFEAHARACAVEGIEDGAPAARQFGKAFLHESVGPRWIRIEKWPQQPSRHCHMSPEAESSRCACGQQQLILGPGRACRRIAPYRRWQKHVEDVTIDAVCAQHMALPVCRQFGDEEAMAREQSLHLLAVGVALGGFGEVEDCAVEGRQLHRLEAFLCGPRGEGLKAIEGWLGRKELRQKNAGTIDRLHVIHPVRNTR